MEFSPAGGHSMSLGLCPTKLPMTWDTRVGHSGVPAEVQPFQNYMVMKQCLVLLFGFHVSKLLFPVFKEQLQS